MIDPEKGINYPSMVNFIFREGVLASLLVSFLEKKKKEKTIQVSEGLVWTGYLLVPQVV